MKRLAVPLVVCVFVFITVGSVSADGGAPGVHCKQIHAYIETTFTSPTTTIGVITGDGWLNGTTNYAADNLIGGPAPATFSYSGELIILIEETGTLTLRDVGVFLASPNAPFAEYATVIGGTGKYVETSGLLFIHGNMNADGTGFNGDISGELCLVKP